MNSKQLKMKNICFKVKEYEMNLQEIDDVILF